MLDGERLAAQLAIHDLNAAFAHHLDHNEVAALLQLFTHDAEYSNGSRSAKGHAEIEAFLRGRTAGGPRTSRHLYSGLRIRFDGADRATGTSVWMSFARNGLPPVAHSTPFLVADFLDTYRCGTDGTWRIAVRQIQPVFRDPDGQPPGART